MTVEQMLAVSKNLEAKAEQYENELAATIELQAVIMSAAAGICERLDAIALALKKGQD